MPIKIPQRALEPQNVSNANNSPESRLKNLLDVTKDLSLKKNGKLFISYHETMRVSMELWTQDPNTLKAVQYKFDDTPASEELIQALIYLIFNEVEELKNIIPTLTDKPVEEKDICLDLCLDFAATYLKRGRSNSQLNGIPHISCSFSVPEKDSKGTSTITIYVRDSEINRQTLAGLYEGVDTAIHL